MAQVTRFRRMAGERGAELIEMALVLPVLLLVLAGIVDFGFMFREWSVVTNAAREGARAAILDGYADEDVRSRVQQYMDASGAASPCSLGGGAPCIVTVAPQTVTTAAGSFQAQAVTVTTFHQWSFMGPFAAWFGGAFDSIALTSRAVMRSEVQATAAP
jgi:Flp pilus assembly protein TadG